MATDALKFTLDRIDTPVGEMLIVQDEHECLRALDWQEYEERMYKLLDRYYGKCTVELIPGDGGGRVVDALRHGADEVRHVCFCRTEQLVVLCP